MTFISQTLNVGMGSGVVDINGDTLRIRNQRTIANSSDSGQQGEICYDNSYLYICISSNTWRRISLGGAF